ncbi:hypothetical protein BDN72DRAFT_810181 [Pluteus cervinus]|uniref:Uncharacterized protein n=1 Tax=Pluteus cervinus TaxID=181527 RepID=A0ACD3BCQ9_9AGAR|nr:hypothetical protein BDN72DRAFT_810181 [Pluteus cervinus]
MAKDDQQMAPQSRKKKVEDDQLPADLGQKPVQLQRRRVWRACESCRRKKIKCDGCEPTCSQCSMSGSTCTWLQTKDRAALSRHYVQELEARLLHMESIFNQLAPVLEQLPGVNGTTLSTLPTAAGTPASDNPAPETSIPRPNTSQEQPAESTPPTIDEEDDDVSESFGQLALDEYGHMRWIGGSSTMSLIQSFKALTSSPLHRISPMEEDPHAPGPSVNKLYFPAAVFFGKVHALPGPEEVEWPDRDLADKLVEAYFAKLHFLMPVVDKPSFLRQYKEAMENQHDPDTSRSKTPFLSLVFAVFACAAQLVEDVRLSTGGQRGDDGGMGMVYYERALILQYISHANIQIAHVQGFILMSSFLCSINCLPQAWILIGQGIRTGQDLGLHRSPKRLTITSIEKETRRKVWWALYVLDRMLALALGRPLGINDSDCDVELPVDVDDDYLPEYFAGASLTPKQRSLMAGTVCMIQLYNIGGRVLRQVYGLENCRDQLEPERKVELQKLVESLDNELTKWCDDLPAIFKSQSETDEQVSLGAVLCSHYYSILTTLHRNLIPVKRDSPVTAKSTFKAVSSARSCIRLAPSMKNVVPPSHHLAFFIQHLFSSGVILLLYAMHAPDSKTANAAMEEAKSTLGALEYWEGHWPGARKCKELLVDLANTASEAINANLGTNGSASTAAQASSSGPQRRRSVTIASIPSSTTPPGRVTKGRPRRNVSRDPSVSSSSRRLAAVSPYRVDSQRARSSSRRRGRDEGENAERSGPIPSYYHTFPSPPSNHGTNSPHSSPASVNLPSPNMTVLDPPQEASPQMSNATIYNYASPISPVQNSSPPRFGFDYGVNNGNPPQAQQTWTNGNANASTSTNGAERRSMDYIPSSQDSNMYGTPYGTYPPSVDGFGGYDGMTGITNTQVIGLPFHGLEYIRNYNPSGLMGEQDSLWQSYDPGAFGLDPDLPFVFGELPTTPQDLPR